MFQTMRNCWSVNAKSFSPPLFLFSHVMYVSVCVCVCVCFCFWNIHSSFPYRLERLELILFAIPASLESSLNQLPHLHTLVVWPDTSHDIMVSCLCILWPCFCDCDVLKVSVSVLWLWCAQGFCVCLVARFLCLSCDQVSVSVLWPGFCVCLVTRFLCLSCGLVYVSVLWPSVYVSIVLPGFCICLVAKFLCLSHGQISMSVSWPNFCVSHGQVSVSVLWPGFCVCLVARFLCLSLGQVSMSVSWPGFCGCLVVRFLWPSRGQVSVSSVLLGGRGNDLLIRSRAIWRYNLVSSCSIISSRMALSLSFFLISSRLCCFLLWFLSFFLSFFGVGWGGGSAYW